MGIPNSMRILYNTSLLNESWALNSQGALCNMNYKVESIPIIILNNRSIVRCEVFTAVTIMNAIFWDVIPCGSC
jgi:hypothetical protein